MSVRSFSLSDIRHDHIGQNVDNALHHQIKFRFSAGWNLEFTFNFQLILSLEYF